ncbi:hypothetical protein [Cerasicoccus frondis]|uniref:hypothetical protein n=1 Tax=Cerasicoccus frondis TaxID=490090 RepID=UPI00285283A3|nr:hypothetical protein [Cerasicoccus frondis]
MKLNIIHWAALISVVPTVANAVLNPGFAGTTESAAWYDLNRDNPLLSEANGYNHNYQTPTLGWAQPLADMTGTTSATLDKITGTDLYVAGGGLFSFSGDGTLFVSDASPIANLQTILFQVDINNVVGTESFVSVPTLFLNGSTDPIAADFTDSISGGLSFAEDSTLFLFQWDLSDAGPISSYEIDWTTGAYYYNYEISVDTSDTAYTAMTVPEPQTYAMIAGFGVLCIAVIRKRHSK